jgi:pimeloyl-ACP methyl ester carboxylesterase
MVTVSLMLVAGLPTCGNVCSVGSTTQNYGVNIERGARRTNAGDRVPYSLFLPQHDETLPAPPYPAIVLSHGFGRDKRFHRNTGCALAERGIIVLTPNLTSLLSGERGQLRNIENLTDHVRWLRSRAADPLDSLFGLIDPSRIGLVGHSAGGAIAFEATIDLADAGEAVSAVMLMDAVPWERTVELAGELRNAAFASVRSEPGACNADGQVFELLNGLAFATEDVLVVGASHCDPENPTNVLCKLGCRGSDGLAQEAYQELLYAFLYEALAAPELDATVSFEAAVERLAEEDRVVSTPVGGPSDIGSTDQ